MNFNRGGGQGGHGRGRPTANPKGGLQSHHNHNHNHNYNHHPANYSSHHFYNPPYNPAHNHNGPHKGNYPSPKRARGGSAWNPGFPQNGPKSPQTGHANSISPNRKKKQGGGGGNAVTTPSKGEKKRAGGDIAKPAKKKGRSEMLPEAIEKLKEFSTKGNAAGGGSVPPWLTEGFLKRLEELPRVDFSGIEDEEEMRSMIADALLKRLEVEVDAFSRFAEPSIGVSQQWARLGKSYTISMKSYQPRLNVKRVGSTAISSGACWDDVDLSIMVPSLTAPNPSILPVSVTAHVAKIVQTLQQISTTPAISASADRTMQVIRIAPAVLDSEPQELFEVDRGWRASTRLHDSGTGVVVDVGCHLVNGNVEAGFEEVKRVLADERWKDVVNPLVRVLRQYFLVRGLTDTENGGLSTYALTLWVIGYLRLHPLLYGGVDSDEQPKTKINGKPSPLPFPTNLSRSLGVLFLDFCHLFGKCFDFSALMGIDPGAADPAQIIVDCSGWVVRPEFVDDAPGAAGILTPTNATMEDPTKEALVIVEIGTGRRLKVAGGETLVKVIDELGNLFDAICAAGELLPVKGLEDEDDGVFNLLGLVMNVQPEQLKRRQRSLAAVGGKGLEDSAVHVKIEDKDEEGGARSGSFADLTGSVALAAQPSFSTSSMLGSEGSIMVDDEEEEEGALKEDDESKSGSTVGTEEDDIGVADNFVPQPAVVAAKFKNQNQNQNQNPARGKNKKGRGQGRPRGGGAGGDSGGMGNGGNAMNFGGPVKNNNAPRGGGAKRGGRGGGGAGQGGGASRGPQVQQNNAVGTGGGGKGGAYNGGAGANVAGNNGGGVGGGVSGGGGKGGGNGATGIAGDSAGGSSANSQSESTHHNSRPYAGYMEGVGSGDGYSNSQHMGGHPNQGMHVVEPMTLQAAVMGGGFPGPELLLGKSCLIEATDSVIVILPASALLVTKELLNGSSCDGGRIGSSGKPSAGARQHSRQDSGDHAQSQIPDSGSIDGETGSQSRHLRRKRSLKDFRGTLPEGSERVSFDDSVGEKRRSAGSAADIFGAVSHKHGDGNASGGARSGNRLQSSPRSSLDGGRNQISGNLIPRHHSPSHPPVSASPSSFKYPKSHLSTTSNVFYASPREAGTASSSPLQHSGMPLAISRSAAAAAAASGDERTWSTALDGSVGSVPWTRIKQKKFKDSDSSASPPSDGSSSSTGPSTASSVAGSIEGAAASGHTAVEESFAVAGAAAVLKPPAKDVGVPNGGHNIQVLMQRTTFIKEDPAMPNPTVLPQNNLRYSLSATPQSKSTSTPSDNSSPQHRSNSHGPFPTLPSNPVYDHYLHRSMPRGTGQYYTPYSSAARPDVVIPSTNTTSSNPRTSISLKPSPIPTSTSSSPSLPYSIWNGDQPVSSIPKTNTFAKDLKSDPEENPYPRGSDEFDFRVEDTAPARARAQSPLSNNTRSKGLFWQPTRLNSQQTTLTQEEDSDRMNPRGWIFRPRKWTAYHEQDEVWNQKVLPIMLDRAEEESRLDVSWGRSGNVVDAGDCLWCSL
ncbi:hypothetical protein HDU97_005336 [Phlyctochytrium planicorne]|nr:hypothetical protein HDU97_005336 [Phlyctochytrium planicorne]